jgi:D-amino-acid dehydrogenase
MLFDPTKPLFLKWGYLPRLMPWLARYLSHANGQDVARIASALFGIIGDSLADHQALAADTPAARYVVPSDYLYIYRDRAAFEADAFGWRVRAAHGFQWEELEGDAFQAYDPCFGPSQRFAVKLGGHGRISDPGAYVKALAAEFERLGGRVLRAEVKDVVRAGGRIVGLRAGGETIACDAAALCAGAWSGPLARAFGVKVPLESERGYHLELWEPSVMPRAPVMVASGKFVATPMDGRLRLAGVVEFGGLEAPPSRAPFALLRRNVEEAIPGIRWGETTEWMGHRPAPADSIPVIGESPALSGAFLGFGHHHVGLTGGPKTGRLLADLIGGRSPTLTLRPMRRLGFKWRKTIRKTGRPTMTTLAKLLGASALALVAGRRRREMGHADGLFGHQLPLRGRRQLRRLRDRRHRRRHRDRHAPLRLALWRRRDQARGADRAGPDRGAHPVGAPEREPALRRRLDPVPRLLLRRAREAVGDRRAEGRRGAGRGRAGLSLLGAVAAAGPLLQPAHRVGLGRCRASSSAPTPPRPPAWRS